MSNLIVAVDLDWGFGKEGNIPWNIPEDFKHFMKTTKKAACLMGKNTYIDMQKIKQERLGDKYNRMDPILKDRNCFVLTENVCHVSEDAQHWSLSVREWVRLNPTGFILGGERVFIEALPFVNRIIMTIIGDYYGCDKHLPHEYILKTFKCVDTTPIKTKEHGTLCIATLIRK